MDNFLLLTGGTGFIGSQVLKNLLEKKEKVLVLKRPTSNTWRINSLIEKYSDNLKFINSKDIDDAFLNYNIEGIFHLATYYTKFHKTNDINDMISSNVTFPTTLLENSINHEVEFFLNTGSFIEYSLNQVPITENSKIYPSNLYATTKVAFENILKFYCNEYDLKGCTLKLTNSYGPMDDESKIIPYLISNTVQKKKIIIQSSSREMDFVFVDDIAKAFIKAKENINKINNYECFNIASGESNTIRSIYEKVKDLIGETDVEFHESGMDKVKADNSKAKNVLGWNPLTNLDEGLKITTKYYCKKYNKI